MKRKQKSSKVNILKYIYIFVFILLVVWLVLSIVQKKNPLNVLKGSISELSHNSTTELQKQIAEKDSIISELENKLAVYEGSKTNNRRALVIIDSESLNMRSGPSLNSNIVDKIPANTEVQLLYFDSNTYYIDSQPGQWARIIYGESEGWVWGNYIREI